MPSNRKIVLGNGEYYHIFNRGVEKRPVFTTKHEFSRAVDLLHFYHFANPPLRYSKYLALDKERKQQFLDKLEEKAVEIIAFCLMTNHFHLLVKQITDNGISKFMANFTNSYTKYFNTKHKRVGSLFQGAFKAVHIESDEQLLHLSRYIHLNPVMGYLVKVEELSDYRWSSYPSYIGKTENKFINKDTVLSFFKKFKRQKDYAEFVLNKTDYTLRFMAIEHLVID